MTEVGDLSLYDQWRETEFFLLLQRSIFLCPLKYFDYFHSLYREPGENVYFQCGSV